MVYVYAESEGRYPLMVGVFLVSKNHVFCLKTEKYSASMGVNGESWYFFYICFMVFCF